MAGSLEHDPGMTEPSGEPLWRDPPEWMGDPNVPDGGVIFDARIENGEPWEVVRDGNRAVVKIYFTRDDGYEYFVYDW